MDTEQLVDVEAILQGEPEGRKHEMRLWLRLLSCSNLISNEIRRRLRTEFSVTLPRFDLLAQLHREPNGLRLGELSRRMMVTNGNLTGLVDRLIEEGLVSRHLVEEDRRASVVRMTPEGEAMFARMAKVHETWLADMFSAIDKRMLNSIYKDLDVLKASVKRNIGSDSDA